MDKRAYIMNRLQEHYNFVASQGYNIFAVMLHGSQNYQLDEYSDKYMSDIDSKAIIIPSLDDLILNKEYSYTHVTELTEHIDIKDIRSIFNTLKKQNITYLEILFTEYYIINPLYEAFFKELINNKEKIIKISKDKFIATMCGHALQKAKNYNHMAPHSEKAIAKYGYDPKELHHLLRLKEFCERFILEQEDFATCLIPRDMGQMKRIKQGLEYTYEEAIEQVAIAKTWIEDFKAKVFEPWPEEFAGGAEFLDDLAYRVIRKTIEAELK